MTRTVELVHFAGCPLAEAARHVLRSALRAGGHPEEWTEWDLLCTETPERVRVYASPTVLVNGADVAGTDPAAVGIACRSGPLPTVGMIREALTT